MIHTCTECGLVHDTTVAPPESPDVAIARIQAASAEAIAKINARSDREWNESREVVAEIEAEADVASATAEAEIVGAALEAGVVTPEPDPAPVITVAPDVDMSQEADPEELPPAEGSPAPEPAAPKSRGLGMW